jgi:ubiquitin carboxyl-terminal hydrolase 47
VLKVLVDKRMFLGTLKKDLEPYVGVPVEYFKIYRLTTGQQELECGRLTENLGSYRDDEKLKIRLDRVLRRGEHRGKVFQLLPNSSEVMLAFYCWELTDIDPKPSYLFLEGWCCYSQVYFTLVNC